MLIGRLKAADESSPYQTGLSVFSKLTTVGRSLEHNVGILVLELKKDKKGKETGQGTLTYAADVSIKDGDTVEIENLGIDPIRLTNARKN